MALSPFVGVSGGVPEGHSKEHASFNLLGVHSPNVEDI
jgi:hypothetical protein